MCHQRAEHLVIAASIFFGAEDNHFEQIVGWKNLEDLIGLTMNNMEEK